MTYLWVVILLTGGICRAASDDDSLPVNEKAESRLAAIAGKDYKIKRTDHFIIAYNTKRSQVNRLARRVEATYNAVYRFCAEHHIETRRPEQRLEIIFFNEPVEYHQFSRKLKFNSLGTFGLYHFDSNRSAFFNVNNAPGLLALDADMDNAKDNIKQIKRQLREYRNDQMPIQIQFNDGRTITITKAQAEEHLDRTRRTLDELDEEREAFSIRINRTVIQHETAHQVLFNAGVHQRQGYNPMWAVEGLAMMFETPPSSLGTGLHAVNYARLQDFRALVAGHEADNVEDMKLTGEDFRRAVKAGRLPSLQTLVSEPDLFHSRDVLGTNLYAATWALMHYLQRREDDKLAAFLKACHGRNPAEPDPREELAFFEAYFGPLDDQFVDEMCTFVFLYEQRTPGRGWY